MFFRNPTITLAVVLSLGFLAGCGGSTQGTGGITVEGRLIEVSGAPIGGAIVTVVATGDATATAEDGGFSVAAPENEAVELLFESGETSATASIPVTSGTTRVAGTFKLDRERDTVETDEVEIEERHGDDDGSDSADDSFDENDDSDSQDGESDDDSIDDGEDSSNDDPIDDGEEDSPEVEDGSSGSSDSGGGISEPDEGESEDD